MLAYIFINPQAEMASPPWLLTGMKPNWDRIDALRVEARFKIFIVRIIFSNIY
jgi:hypothetical protein